MAITVICRQSLLINFNFLYDDGYPKEKSNTNTVPPLAKHTSVAPGKITLRNIAPIFVPKIRATKFDGKYQVATVANFQKVLVPLNIPKNVLTKVKIVKVSDGLCFGK